ncbi:hypothetical protein M409DRAFT_58507 [Zasmidium cellare ATCC 36951]|uniref:Riboflavin kinase n=1 Tax=Zasmidium cellare ATCC 36951 TaxID=1080233 RepID=A0A6A6C764_ZASCE|nr:uncharacterized protein M409DRAFT_58507 [Zasmidium cellare ATCC 36951]KAF2162050.1 hypothetical protein M409DRAFT_58507 [Zasmidium cellare ATCC 36951]
MIQRKPVPGGRPLNVDQKQALDKVMGETRTSPDSKPPPYEFEKVESIQEGQIIDEFDQQLEALHLDSEPDPSEAPPGASHESVEQATASSKNPSKVKAALGTAYNQAVHFAGGLVSHPFEATKHYSVLRHSIGLVYYRGPTTSVAITVFSDQPLPPDRKLWLQKRGFSGKTGLAVGKLGTRSAWIDVTPTISATPDALPKADERAWQRDINKFRKKAKDVKQIRNHRPYETNVVRIPHVAADGYFRIVLCEGRKVLCPSPVFRYASTSTDPGMLRGASLRSLPLELGIKIGAMVANNAANAAAAGAVQPVTTAVQNAVQPYQYGGLTQMAATSVYDSSGAPQKIEEVNEVYEQRRELSHQQAIVDADARASLIGSDDGPEHPFPIRLTGKVIPGTGRSRSEFGMPTANISDVAEDTILRLSGVYVAWAMVSPPKKLKEHSPSNGLYDVWHPAIVTAAPLRKTHTSVVEKKSISAYLINDFDNTTFFDSKVHLMVMGFMHPVLPSSTEEQALQIAQDVAIAQASLERPAWQAETLLFRIETESSSRSFTERVADVREAGQKQVDKVPVHWLGVRTDSMGLKDQLIGNGGICVRR